MPRRPPLPGALLVTAALLLPGCGSISVTTGADLGPPRAHWVNRYFWGVIGGDLEVDATGLARVEVDDTLLQMLLSLVSGGIYCPITITVWPPA